MPTTLSARTWIDYVTRQIYFNDSTPNPDRSKFYAMLALGSLNDNSSIESIIAAENIKTPSNNYNRYNANVISEPIYDTGNKRYTTPVMTWTASFNEAVQYNSVVMIADGTSRSNAAIASYAPGSGIFTLSDHGLTDSDPVMITPDASGAMPTGISSTQKYYAKVESVSQFKIYSESALTNQIIGTTTGSALRLRYAKGRFCMIRSEDSILTLAAFQPRSWNFYLGAAAYSGIGQGS